jgi:hypothetical protein
MNELHDEFDAWIAAGARGDPPRAVAMHASGCDACLHLAASFDALLAIDPGLAPPPPLRAAPVSPLSRAPIRIARSAAAAVAVMLVIGAGAIVGANVFRPPLTDVVADVTPAPIAEGVLGAAGAPSLTPSASASASASATASPSGEASASASPTATPRPVIAAVTPNPTMGGGPPPASAVPATPVPTPRVTPAPTTPAPAPSVAPATPTPAASAPPSPTPTPVPDPTPTPELPSSSPTESAGAADLVDLVAELLP